MMEAPMCKLCEHRHWDPLAHVGFEPDQAPRYEPYIAKIEKMPHSVYGLIDPRNGHLFYIGCTMDLEQRLRNHRYNRSHAPVGPVNTEIRAAGLFIQHKVFGVFGSLIEGRWAERELIRTTPNLVNSSHPANHGTLSYLLYPPDEMSPEEARASHNDFLRRYHGVAA